MTRFRSFALLAACALGLGACIDDPAVRDRLGIDENGSPVPVVSPTSFGGPTPVPEAPVMGEAPASGPASAAPTTAASGTVAPSPLPSGEFVRTYDPLDLAISGPGYFVLSTELEPDSFEDLLFTRHGSFELRFVGEASPAPGSVGTPVLGGPGRYRLQTPEGLYVLGFDYEGPEGTRVPAEARGSSYPAAFTLETVEAGPLALDAVANANLRPHFNFKGQLLNQERPPLGREGEPRQMFVAIAQVEKPEALGARPGLPAYEWRSEAGVVRVGIAGVRGGEADLRRPVGEANLILPETIEY